MPSVCRSKGALRPLARAQLLLVTSFAIACSPPAQEAESETASAEREVPLGAAAIQLSSTLPTDLASPAPDATLSEAADFAWREFVALNWPAVAQNGLPGTRGVAAPGVPFGGAPGAPLTWETYRGKVEIYPGQPGQANVTPPAVVSPTVSPNGYVDDAGVDYGFDAAPEYLYDPASVGSYPGLISGTIPPDVGQSAVSQPAWLNLDEDNEIEEDTMFAGAASMEPYPGQQFLYAAKANRSEYTYVAKNGWWAKQPGADVPPQVATAGYVFDTQSTPPAGATGSDEFVSFPPGTVEVKSAWRRLTDAERDSGRFHMAPVRFYAAQLADQTYAGQTGNPNFPAWQQETWGLCALHIIHKTPTAPYFVYATFEQIDNIQTADGLPVEDAAGQLIRNASLDPFDPVIVSTPATATAAQVLEAQGPFITPDGRLYYTNLPTPLVPPGPIAVNRRAHAIPPEIIAANQAYQAAIADYDEQLGVNNSPWRNYRLVNVQFKPLDKATPGAPYAGADPSTYYLSNSVVETDFNLQNFSGKLATPASTNGLITDFYTASNNGVTPTNSYPVGSAAHNTPFDGRFYNMGGCMGCHGNIAELGADFSFILNSSSVAKPEFELGDQLSNQGDAR